MSGTYDIGGSSRLTGTFVDLNGNLADPSSVTVRIRQPDGSTVTFSGTRISVGLWKYDLALAQVGIYYYRFEGAGAIVAAGDGYLTVVNSVTLEPSPYPAQSCCA